MTQEGEILNPGQPECSHEYVSFIYKGQRSEWECDIPNCSRHIKGDYLEEFGLQFPPNSFIRIKGLNQYLWQADEEGIVKELSRKDRINKDSINLADIL